MNLNYDSMDYDSIWILMVVVGLRIIFGTAYLKPNETASM